MAFNIETDIETYGFLSSDGDLLPMVRDHPWAEPFPVVVEPLQVAWEPGESLVKPNIFYHNLLWDLAVDAVALQVLDTAVAGGVRPYATLLVDGVELRVIQATKVLDVVDVDSSIPPDYSWQEFSFPHIPAVHDSITDYQFFRVPNRGAGRLVFIGNSVKRACDEAGLTGLLYYEAVVAPDEWELGLS